MNLRMSKVTPLLSMMDEVLIVISIVTVLLMVLMVVHISEILTLELTVMIIAIILFIVLIAYKVLKVYISKPKVGMESLIGRVGVVVEPLNPRGIVMINGELWRAESMVGEPIPRGAEVEVVGFEGLTLKVKRYTKSTS